MLSEYSKVLEAENREAFQREVVCFSKRMGFDLVNATAIWDKPGEDTAFSWVCNTPEAYVPYACDWQLARRDPVGQHCKRFSTPIAWDQGTYVATGTADKWELQAPFGYRSGIAVALHLPKGLHFFIGVDRDGPLPDSPSELARLAGALQLFASYAQESGLRLLLPEVKPCPEPPSLSRRELQSLWWTMEGKTAWEVGGILGISEQTAAKHLHRAARKLDCANKHHAVVKALRLRLIE